MHRGALLLAGTVLALTGCASQGTFCTTIGCIGQVDVTIAEDVAQRITAETTVTACLDAVCTEKTVLPGAGPISLTISGTELEIDQADLTVVATSGGTEVLSWSTQLTGDRINGAGCSPVCYQASVDLTQDMLTA